MRLFSYGLALALVSMVLLMLQKAYAAVPARELKRRARASDRQAARLYRVTAYGPNTHLLLAVLIGLAAAGSFVLLARAVQPLVAFGVLAVVVWIGFVWLPATSRLQRFGLQLAAWASPILAKLLGWMYSVTHFITNLAGSQPARLRPSDLYETEDLLVLLEKQKQIPTNRIPEHQLQAATRLLQFADRTVDQVMLPRAEVKLVSADDTIGPLLLDELHESGQRSFLVYEGKRDHLVGTINLHDALSAGKDAKVSDLMRANLCFVNEAQSLEDVLQAFQTTRQPVFAVVNRADDFVGIIGIEHLLAEALGEVTASEPLAYEDRQAIANYQPVLQPIAVPEDELSEEPEPLQELDQDQIADESETLPPEPPEVVE